MITGPTDSTSRTSAVAVAVGWRWTVRIAVLVLALLLAFEAAAQSTATKDLSGPTLRLFKAVELNDMAAVKGSLDDGADINKENEGGMTAADLAVDMGHFIIAHYLLSRRLLGDAAPVVLAPAAKPDRAKAAPAAKAKPTFAKPPAKPSAPAVAAKPETTPDPAAEPAAPPSKTAGKPAAADAPEGPPATVAEMPAAPADKPLGDIGVAQFFKSLVDMITPGGEKPADVAAAKAAKDKQAAPPARRQPADKAAATEPPDIVVEISGDAPPTGEVIKEVKEAPPPKLADKDLETVTAETVTAEPDKDKAKAAAKPKDEDEPKPGAKPKDEAKPKQPAAPTPAAPKPEKPAESVLDRMAGLLKSEQKKAEPPAAAPKPAAKTAAAPAAVPAPAPAAPAAGQAAAAAAQPPGAAKPTPTPPAAGAVATYELPTPATPPAGPTKFSPRFLDKLADFLETGDEAAFKAWLPEMQIMGADAAGQRKAPPAIATPGDAATPAAKAEVPAAAAKDAVTTAKPEAAAAAPEGSAADAMEADLAGIAGETTAVAVAAVAAGAPARAAPASAIGKPGMIKGAVDKLLGVLTPGGRDMAQPERLVLEPEEKLAAVDKAAGQAAAAAPADTSQKVWPVTEVETAKTPPIASMRPMSDVLLKTSLTGVTLSLGESVSLENSFPPAQDGVDPQNQCVKKNRGTTLFCLEPIDWPDRVQADFLVPTILYTGHMAIARYDQGIASRFHALYPAEAFERVIGYFRDRFGEPTDIWNRSIAPFAQPRQDNPTLAWRSVDPNTGAVSVLEIRKYDDTRGGFPDINRGAVMLYLANSPPIFPQVSSHELMRLSRTRMGPPTGESPNAIGEPAPAGEPGAQPDLSLPEPGAEPEPPKAGPAGAAAEPGAEGKSEKQLKDEERTKRRAEREAKRAAGAAKQAAGAAQQEIGAKRATKPATAPAAKPPARAVPKPPDQSLDLPPEPTAN